EPASVLRKPGEAAVRYHAPEVVLAHQLLARHVEFPRYALASKLGVYSNVSPVESVTTWRVGTERAAPGEFVVLVSVGTFIELNDERSRIAHDLPIDFCQDLPFRKRSILHFVSTQIIHAGVYIVGI